MKFKTKRKQINNYYGRIYQVGYCDLYPLYNSSDATGYTCGVYGWNYDVYEINAGTCITSGYRGMFGLELPPEARRVLELAKKYCSNAAGHSWQEQERYLKRARKKFAELL